MIVVLIFVVLVMVGGAILIFDDDAEGILLFAFSACLAIALLTIPISLACYKVDIAKFESRRSSIKQQRDIPATEYERVALSKSIVDDNMWLAGVQQSKRMKWVNWYIPKDILDIKPIK